MKRSAQEAVEILLRRLRTGWLDVVDTTGLWLSGPPETADDIAARLAVWAKPVLGTIRGVQKVSAGYSSTRKTFRITHERGTCIAHWTPRRSEAEAAVVTGDYLRGQGLHLPRILNFDPQAGFFLMEDLGATIAALRPAALPGDIHGRIAAELGRFHSSGSGPDKGGARPFFFAPYSEKRWQRFCGKYLEPWFATESASFPDAVFRRMERELAAYAKAIRMHEGPRSLLHTDWHFNNLIFKDEKIYVLDWQGATMGPCALDLAQLLMFANHGAWNRREEILGAYLAAHPLPSSSASIFYHQLELFEAGFLLRVLPRLSRHAQAPVRPNALLLKKLAAVQERDCMRPYPAFRDFLRAVADTMRELAVKRPNNSRTK